MLGLLLGVTVANGMLDDSDIRGRQDAKTLAQIAEATQIIARQAKREEMRQFLNVRGLISTDAVLNQFRYD